MTSPERAGVTANGVFYAHTPHFLESRELKHTEATDDRIYHVLESPEVVFPLQGNRRVYWSQIREQGSESWWMKVVVAENPGGPAILTAYRPDAA